MDNKAYMKKIHKFYFESVAKQNKNQSRPALEKPNAGFTLIEMIVVVIIIGVLSAIAAPSWLAFLNRQRVSKVNDAVFSALQTAQTEAKRTKLSYGVCFKQDSNDIPRVAVYSIGSSPTPCANLNLSQWKPLAENQDINSKQIALATAPNTNPIVFDYQGTVSLSTGQTLPLTVTVAIPPNNSTKRCTVVQTLLGSMITGQDDYNATSNPKGCRTS